MLESELTSNSLHPFTATPEVLSSVSVISDLVRITCSSSKMQISEPHPRPIQSEFLGRGKKAAFLSELL